MSTRHSNLSLRILAGLELALLAAVILTGIKLVFTTSASCSVVVFAAILVLGGWLAFYVTAAGAVGVCSSRSEVCCGCLF